MSELTDATNNRGEFRRRLLNTVSALVLLGAVLNISRARADGGEDRPTVWIEFGGQFEQLQGGQEPYLPLFINPEPSFVTISPRSVQRPLRSSFGGESKIQFQPDDSDWIFSAAARYGRANGSRHAHQQTAVGTSIVPGKYYTETHYEKFADASTRHTESHSVLDFSAGRDVGLGRFVPNVTSVLSGGLRFAQFVSKSNTTVEAVPTVFHEKYVRGLGTVPIPKPYDFRASEHDERSFRGIGPSLSWDASADVLRGGRASIGVDWGVNAALLFGRQKVRVHSQTAEYIAKIETHYRTTAYDHRPPDRTRTKSVVVPNFGGFAGLSIKFPNAKLSLGYRADFFFGAMDGGIDTAKKENVGFYGPFATISIGL